MGDHGVGAAFECRHADLSLGLDVVGNGDAAIVAELVGGRDLGIVMADAQHLRLGSEHSTGAGPGRETPERRPHLGVGSHVPQEGNPLVRTIDEANFVARHCGRLVHGRNLQGQGGEFHEPSLVVAKLGRRDAKVLPEGPRERLVSTIAGIERYLDDGPVGTAQP